MNELTPQLNEFGEGQKAIIGKCLSDFMTTMAQVAPKIAPHLLSGGVMTVSTMSGMTLKFGFAPQKGGLILPGGITPNKRSA